MEVESNVWKFWGEQNFQCEVIGTLNQCKLCLTHLTLYNVGWKVKTLYRSVLTPEWFQPELARVIQKSNITINYYVFSLKSGANMCLEEGFVAAMWVEGEND